MLCNSHHGLSIANARHIFLATILPIISYGSPIYFTNKRQNKLLQPFQLVQNKLLRWIVGAFCTTLVDSLHHLTSILPIQHNFSLIKHQSTIRILKLPHFSPVSQYVQSFFNRQYTIPRHVITRTYPYTNPLIYASSLIPYDTE